MYCGISTYQRKDKMSVFTDLMKAKLPKVLFGLFNKPCEIKLFQ